MSRKRVLGSSLVVVALLGGLRAQAQQPAARTVTVGQAMAEVAQTLKSAKGTKGEERKQIFGRAAEQYERLLEQFAADRSACARINFALGEAWRRHGSFESAAQAYGRAVELDAARFAARAGLQQAHAQRRIERLDDALAGYRRVAALAPESGATREALVWIGRGLEAKGDARAAIEAYRDALDRTKHVRTVIDLCNRLAKALIAQGDLDGAEGALRRAERSVPETGAGAERLRSSVAAMSARKALQRARDKRDGAHRDARGLEASRKR